MDSFAGNGIATDRSLWIDVLVASFGKEGIRRLSRLVPPTADGVRWIISSQIPDGDFPSLPENLQRNDIIVRFSDSSGSARNRNLLLDMASAPVCLVADDDLVYSKEQLDAVIRVFKENPDVAVATFRYRTFHGSPEDFPGHEANSFSLEKYYPDHPFPLDRMAKGYYVSAIEIAFRRKVVAEKGIRFNEYFGINQKYACGEDTLFLHDIIKSGLKGSFFPVTITTHFGPSTGTRLMGNADVLRAQGVIIPRLYPCSAFPRLVLKAWRSAKGSESSFIFCLRHILRGWADHMLHKHRLFPQPKAPEQRIFPGHME